MGVLSAVNEEWRMLCEKTLTAEEVERFAVACEEDYYVRCVPPVVLCASCCERQRVS